MVLYVVLHLICNGNIKIYVKHESSHPIRFILVLVVNLGK